MSLSVISLLYQRQEITPEEVQAALLHIRSLPEDQRQVMEGKLFGAVLEAIAAGNPQAEGLANAAIYAPRKELTDAR